MKEKKKKDGWEYFSFLFHVCFASSSMRKYLTCKITPSLFAIAVGVTFISHLFLLQTRRRFGQVGSTEKKTSSRAVIPTLLWFLNGAHNDDISIKDLRAEPNKMFHEAPDWLINFTVCIYNHMSREKQNPHSHTCLQSENDREGLKKKKSFNESLIGNAPWYK